ncbi:putative nuclease HARBI1 [Aphis craccivora]|uniref:Putative nuclease HARBI1 n=1 Tax=Aphis craccivora TaxID=307492 RepID=A0A6G0VNS0_APHCR|nr:putative nuclease HARBI1 [Aphis craccivora]
MYRRVVFDDDDENDDEVIAMQRRPKIFYERVNYLELYDDHDFLNRFRLSKATFNTILRLIENEISPPSTRNKAILPPSKLYMMLRYLATGSFLLCISDFAGVSESSARRYVHQVCRAIARQRPNFISFPTNDVDEKRIVNGFYSLSRFPRVVGAVDCTHIKIQSPGGDNAEIFRNRKGWFSTNTQCVCNPWLKIMDIVARWPGSCHDQIIFDNSNVKHKFETGVIKGYLLGDGGYEVKPYLMTPLLNPTTRSQQLYNESHIRTRNVIERCFGVMKRRFPVLSKGLTVDLKNTQAIIVACAVLHNVCIEMHDILPDDELMEENNRNNDVNHRDDHNVNLAGTRGRQQRDRLVNDHFANLQ